MMQPRRRRHRCSRGTDVAGKWNASKLVRQLSPTGSALRSLVECRSRLFPRSVPHDHLEAFMKRVLRIRLRSLRLVRLPEVFQRTIEPRFDCGKQPWFYSGIFRELIEAPTKLRWIYEFFEE